MIRRHATYAIEDALRRQAVVALIGPRQVGKTTLALQIGETRNAIYLDLEDPDDRNKLSNPVLFFEHVQDRLVILDEIHRLPNLFDVLRGVVDKGRRINKGKGRFLILGSAAIDLLRQSSETLAGRIAYIYLNPLSVLEIDPSQAALERLWLRGGFPDSYLADDDQDSFSFRRDFIRTYLERDIPMFGPRVPSTTLERFWTMLAHLQGSILNASRLARSLEVSVQSVTRYVDLLSDLLLVRRLKPYNTNMGKRLVKSPKVYIRDSGLTHALLGISTFPMLVGHPVVGMSWEGYALETLLSVLPWRSSSFFYRTAAGAEIDLVIEQADGKLWAIEIKRSLSAKPNKGFLQACEDLKASRRFIVYAGRDRYPISHHVEAISIHELSTMLQAI